MLEALTLKVFLSIIPLHFKCITFNDGAGVAQLARAADL